MQKRLDNSSFLTTLAQLLQRSEQQGSVYLEQKRLSRTGSDATLDAAEAPYAVLFRATDGARDKEKRIKISTVVPAENLEVFWRSYTATVKEGMGGLRRGTRKVQTPAAAVV